MSTRYDALLRAIDRWTGRLDELLELEPGMWLSLIVDGSVENMNVSAFHGFSPQ